MKKRRYKKNRQIYPRYLHFFIIIGVLPTRIFAQTILVVLRLLSAYALGASSAVSTVRRVRVPKFHFPKFPKARIPKIPFPRIVFPKIHIPRSRVVFPRIPLSYLALPFLLLFFLTTLGVFFYFYILKDLPKPTELATRKPIVSTKIYDRNNVLLYTIYRDENRTPIPLSNVPLHMKQATVAIEDKDFYSHKGLSLRGIVRALRTNIQSGSLQGGSTITQQLVKNTLLSPEKTIRRKLREIILAIQTEMAFSKDAILEMYLNEVSYGGSLYGIEEASEAYFGKSASQLTLAEAAMLAGLPKAPSVYSPFGPHPEQAFTRQHEVLDRMVEDGYITPEQAETSKEEHIAFQQNRTPINAPHFVMYVRELLATMFGEDVVSQGGLEVRTTLDLETQHLAEEAVSSEIERLENLHVTNGAAVVTNPKSGEILAMVGSKDYFDITHDGQVNVTLMPRQPGSSIKAVTYSVALEHGYTPSTILEDTPVTFQIPGSEPYSPQNYDGKFHGSIPLRVAFASSYNVPAVKTLSAIGLQNVIEKGYTMGLTIWDKDSSKRFGLSLTLGGGEVLMVDMAKVYGTFANYGTTVGLSSILSVKNYKGNTLYVNPCENAETPCNGTRTLEPEVAYQITSMLSDNAARAPAFGTHSILSIPGQQVAVKTGTTNSLRDNWTIGYTNDRVVVTWVGNNDNSPMSYVASGITGASPIWRKIIDGLIDGARPNLFATPPKLRKIRICASTGTLPCDECPAVRDEYFVEGTEPQQSCSRELFTHITEQQVLLEQSSLVQ